MMMGLLWIIGIYGACIAILHAVHAWLRRKGTTAGTTYFALITHNNQSQIEWYLRSLIFFSWLRGRYVSIAVFDEGSTDDTLAIVERMAVSRMNVEVRLSTESWDAYMEAHKDDAVIVHDLSRLVQDEPLPLLQW